MALRIKKRFDGYENRAAGVAGLCGLLSLIALPLAQATAVHSPAASTRATPSVASAVACATVPAAHAGLRSATSLHLQKLAQYEQVCHSGVVSRLSFFVATPTSVGEAERYGAEVAAQLHEFHKFGVPPLVFLEPTTTTGLIDMDAYQAGAYDNVLDVYFAAIKAAGVTDAMMGMWVSFPEGNLPVWTSVDPAVFAASVTKTVTYQKKHFPASHASIMLDSITYPTAEKWENGQAISLLPYVKDIPAGLIDSFGLQGFPWMSPATEGRIDNGLPRDYLRTTLAAEAATALQVRDVWFNTGTFGEKYTNDTDQRVTMSPVRRFALLRDIISSAHVLQNQGFSVAVHVFAEDKSDVAEATNWSYWPSGAASSTPSTTVFQAFAGELRAADVPLWLYDTE